VRLARRLAAYLKPAGPPASEWARHSRPCTAPRPISTRFEPVPCLRSFTAGSSRMSSDLARRTRPIWQCQAVPALSALLPASPGFSQVRLRSASTGLLRQPREKVFHLLRFPAPHGARAPRGHRSSGTRSPTGPPATTIWALVTTPAASTPSKTRNHIPPTRSARVHRHPHTRRLTHLRRHDPDRQILASVRSLGDLA